MKSRSHSLVPVVAIALACFLAGCSSPAATTAGRDAAPASARSGTKTGCTPALVAKFTALGDHEVNSLSVRWPSGFGYLGQYQPSCAFENDQLPLSAATRNETDHEVIGLFIGASEEDQNAIFSGSRKRLAGWEESHWDPDWLGDDSRVATWTKLDDHIDGMDVDGRTGLNLASLIGVGQFSQFSDFSNFGLDLDASFLEVQVSVMKPTRP